MFFTCLPRGLSGRVGFGSMNTWSPCAGYMHVLLCRCESLGFNSWQSVNEGICSLKVNTNRISPRGFQHK